MWYDFIMCARSLQSAPVNAYFDNTHANRFLNAHILTG